MRTVVLIDGRAQFGCGLQDFFDYPIQTNGLTFRGHLRSRQIEVPPLERVVPVEPLEAIISQGMLGVICPTCHGQPEEEIGFVWLEGPYLALCGVCGNREVGRLWRPVVLPARLDEILAALAVRPRAMQSYDASMSVEGLLAENARYGWRALDDERKSAVDAASDLLAEGAE